MINKVKDSHDILTLLVPTNEPAVFKDYFLKSLPNISEIAPITTVAFNFQKPWTLDDVTESVNICDKLGFKVSYTLREQYPVESRGLVPFNQIRGDTAKLNPNSMFYALCDDDFEFRGPSASIDKTAGHQYLDAIDYLLKHKKCSHVLFGGTRFKAVPKDHIGIVKLDEWHITGRGFIFRNMSPEFLVFPEDALDLKGAGEEKLIAAARMNKGMYPAKLGFARTRHDEIRRHKPEILSGEEMYGWLKEDIIENNLNKYINDHYRTGISGVYSYNVTNLEEYKNNGGLDCKKNYNECLEDYTGSDADKLLAHIIEVSVDG
jgi:hypothetical protein